MFELLGALPAISRISSKSFLETGRSVKRRMDRRVVTNWSMARNPSAERSTVLLWPHSPAIAARAPFTVWSTVAWSASDTSQTSEPFAGFTLAKVRPVSTHLPLTRFPKKFGHRVSSEAKTSSCAAIEIDYATAHRVVRDIPLRNAGRGYIACYILYEAARTRGREGNPFRQGSAVAGKNGVIKSLRC